MFLRRSPKGLMFPNREVEDDPRVMIRVQESKHDFTFLVESRSGKFYRVIPNSSKEVYYIQMLLKNIDVLVPEEGDGLIISAKAIEHCDYRS